MLAAQAPDIDRLESPDAAVILYLNPGKAVQHVCNLLGNGRLHIQADFFGRLQHGTVPHRDDGGRIKCIRFLGRQAPGNGQQQNCNRETAVHRYQMAKCPGQTPAETVQIFFPET